jgi:hypothetical protein
VWFLQNPPVEQILSEKKILHSEPAKTVLFPHEGPSAGLLSEVHCKGIFDIEFAGCSPEQWSLKGSYFQAQRQNILFKQAFNHFGGRS